ncbi:hypothetical protein ACWCOW_22920 [Streptomyces sp. NPDC001939]
MHEPTAHEPLRKVMDQPRRRPRTTRPPGGRPPGRQDARRPGTRPVRVPPHPAELFTERLLLMLSGQRPVHWASRHFAGSLYDALIQLAEDRPLNDRRVTGGSEWRAGSAAGPGRSVAGRPVREVGVLQTLAGLNTSARQPPSRATSRTFMPRGAR